MPDIRDAARFVQPSEMLARLLESVQRLFVTVLQQADRSKLFCSYRDVPVIPTVLCSADIFLVSGRGFIEPAQVAKAVASFR